MSRQPGSRSRSRESALPNEREDPIDVPNAISHMPVALTGCRHFNFDAHETIASSNCLVIVQCLEPFEMFTGIETQNRYIIYDMYMRRTLYAHENSKYSDRQCLGKARDFEMNIIDNRRKVLMNSVRYGGGYSCSSDYLEIYHLGHPIGLLTRNVFDKNFYLQANGCSTQFVITTPLSASVSSGRLLHRTIPFQIYAQGGSKVGEIVRLNPGFLEMISDADTFMIHFPTDMPPIIKLLILQATFLIDFTFFEHDPSTSYGSFY